jgi:hypothetical protein
MRRTLVIYEFAPDPSWIFLYVRKIYFLFINAPRTLDTTCPPADRLLSDCRLEVLPTRQPATLPATQLGRAELHFAGEVRLTHGPNKTPNSKCRLFLKFTSKGTWRHRCLSVWGLLPPMTPCTVRCEELKLTSGDLFLCYLIGIFSWRSWK